MDIVNETPFSFGCIAGRIPYPGHSLTLIVKATLDLVPDGVVVPSPEQQMTTGDEFYDDDEDMQGGPRYASDFSYVKPLADLSLSGHCHAPENTTAAARQVTFQVGDVVHSLIVYGDRHWIGPVATDPEPFSKFPLRYEYSYGGAGFKKNPIGRGYDKQKDGNGNTARYLPNIMQPGESLATPFSRLAPSGFGPVHREWDQRKSKLGSYKGKYLSTRWPWFAEDIDWRYFNAAPDALQTDFLKGDEALSFENLHARHQSFRSRLPGLKIRCFVNRSTTDNIDTGLFSEVTMNLDTLWADMDDDKVVLVWRGWTEVLSEEFEEIAHILIAAESLTAVAEGAKHYQGLLHQRVREEDELWEEASLAEEPEPEVEDDTEKMLSEGEASYNKAMTDAGMDPDNPPEPSDEDKRRQVQVLEQLGIDPAGEPIPEMTRERVLAQFNQNSDLSGFNLEGLDLSGVDLSGGNLQGTVFSNADLSGTRFDGADLTGALFENANLSEASFIKADLTNADLFAADCSLTNLHRAKMTDAIFDNACLKRASIEHAEASGASFIGADLTEVSLAESVLAGSDLSASNLTSADLTGANLAESTVEGAKGPGVVMDGADLTELRASEKSIFTAGSFKRVTAQESIWEAADLRDADFSFSKMTGAMFTKANLTGACLRAVEMKNARFEKATLKDADLVLVNGLENSFEKADLTCCDCRQANLYGSEFLNAIVDGTLFEGANLKMTKLDES